MRRLATWTLGLALGAGMGWADWYTANILTVSDTSTPVTFGATECNGGVCSSLSVYNSGANPVYVKVYDGCTGPAVAITTSTAGVFIIPATSGYTFDFNHLTECYPGYVGFSKITGAGLTTTINVIGK